MKRFYLVLAVIASCLWHLVGLAQAQPDKAFLGKPIKVTLKNTDMSFETKYGQRSVTGYRVATDKYELRLSLWTLMGEPVEHYVFRMPRVNSLIFEADGGYKKTVTIRSADESKGQNYISESGSNIVASHILVSQDVLDKIKYVDLSFSIETIGLYPLSDAFYSGKDAASRDFFFKVLLVIIIQRHISIVCEIPVFWEHPANGDTMFQEALHGVNFCRINPSDS